jgi:hypothetical protein
VSVAHSLYIHTSTVITAMSQNNNYSQQNPNNMPRRDPPKAPETIEYICGGTIIPPAELVALVADF